MNEFIKCDFAIDQGETPLKKVFGIAYKGDCTINQPWRDAPIVIDLSGVEFSAQIPLLYNHENEPDRRLGVVDAAIIDNAIVIEGVIDTESEKGKKLAELGKRIPWQLSIGASVDEIEYAETAHVNNADFSDVYVVSKCSLREVSVVAVGACKETELQIAAALNLDSQSQPNKKEHTKMEIEDMKKAETARISGIKAALADNADLMATAIAEDWSVSQAESVAKATKAVTAKLPESAPNVIIKDEGKANYDVLKAAFCMRAGVKAEGNDRTLEAAYKMRNISLKEMLAEALRLEGHTVSAHFGNDEIKAACSTIAVPALLSDVANKKVKEAFSAVDPIAPRICKAGDLNDYKESTRVNINAIGEIGEIADGQEIPHVALGESTAKNQVKAHAKMITLGKQAITNDDLGEFLRLPEILGRKAAMQIDKEFFKRLLANPVQADGVALFNSAHGNMLSGSAYALGKDAMLAAKALFGKQVDDAGDPIAVSPKFLLVPNELEGLAQELVISQFANGSTTANRFLPTANVVSRWGLEVIVSPYLSNPNYAGNSATGWYLFADPAVAPTFEIGYLRGQRIPVVESAEAPFNYLGLQFRVTYDFGVREQDHRGMVFANGKD